MRYTKRLAWLALAVGMAFPGAAALSAQDWHGAARLRADMAADRAGLREDIRCGRTRAAAHEARDLARDRRELDRDYYRR
jgi:hypothetical protein